MQDAASRFETPLAELWDKVKSVKIAMLTTVREDGSLRSRPMATQQCDPTDALWFATNVESPMAAELASNPQVCLSYGSADKDLWITVSGTAKLVNDRAKIHELWNPMMKVWWPEGPDDADIRLVEVDLSEAEYWHDRKPKLLQFAQMAVAAVTGKMPGKMGDDRKLTF